MKGCGFYLNLRRISLELARKQWDLATLATEAGIAYETLRRAMAPSGGRRASTKTTGKIVAALGVDVTEIIAEEEES